MAACERGDTHDNGDLRVDGRDPFLGLSVFNFNTRFSSKDVILQVLTSLGLIPSRDDGPKCCGRNMTCEADETYSCGFRFRCNSKLPKTKKYCRKTINPLVNTWFASTTFSFLQVLQLTFFFVRGYKVTDAAREVDIGRAAAIDFYVFCREVCRVIICRDLMDKRIGGEGKHVEVDEAHLCTRKYNVGRVLKSQQEWIFGGRCREDGTSFMVRIPNKKRDTLLPLMQRFIHPDSVIMTDCAKMYDTCVEYGFKAHHSVNHSKNFVDPGNQDVHTQNVERQWRGVKDVVKSYRKGFIDLYLSEYQYRDKYFKKPYSQFRAANEGKPKRERREILSSGDSFKTILQHIALLYPGPGKVGIKLSDYSPMSDIHSDERDVPMERPRPSHERGRSAPAPKQQPAAERPKTTGPTSASAAPMTQDDRVRNHAIDASTDILTSLILDRAYDDVDALKSQLFPHAPTVRNVINLIRGHLQRARAKFDPVVHRESVHAEIPLSFQEQYRCIVTSGEGDCWYNAISTCIFGTESCSPLIRLCTLYVGVAYEDCFVPRLLAADQYYANDPRLMYLGIGTPFSMRGASSEMYPNLIQQLHDDEEIATFNWANELVQTITSLVIGEEIYCYVPFPPATMHLSADDLNAQFNNFSVRTACHLLVGSEGTFPSNHPVRIFWQAGHFEAILPPAQLIIASLPFRPHRSADFAGNITLHADACQCGVRERWLCVNGCLCSA